ncbi:MAG: hypothetical protein ABEJ65_07430 [bacterium]
MGWISKYRYIVLLTVCCLIGGIGLEGILVTPAHSAQTSQDEALANNLDRWNFPIRSIGVGTAYAADANGIQGGLTNPASLSRLQSNEFSIEYQRWGESWDMFNMGIASPQYGGQSVAFHTSWLDYGELEPQEDTELFRPQGNELKSGVTYSYRFSKNSALGVTGNVMSSDIGFRESEISYSVDLGYLYRLNNQIWFGASAKNASGTLQVDTGPEKLPTQVRGGVVWYFLQDRGALTTDLVFHDPGETADEQIGGAGGARILIFNHYRFSAGYHNYYEDRSGMTGAVELVYPDISWKTSYLNTGKDDVIRIGANLRF